MYDVLIVGGGFYGLFLARYFSQKNKSVIVVEQNGELMNGASLINQARVHQGYHYPRSFLTAKRSQANYLKFKDEFKECTDDNFTHYYAIAKTFSNITAHQFEEFAKATQMPLVVRPAKGKSIFSKDYVDDFYEVTEVCFDAVKLKQLILDQLTFKQLSIQKDSAVLKIAEMPQHLEVSVQQKDHLEVFKAGQVFNCTYSGINSVNKKSGLPLISLKYEWAEMALIRLPPVLDAVGITVMDGSFFSTLPYPSKGLNTLSHVRFTPHFSWTDLEIDGVPQLKKVTSVSKMLKDASRFVPDLAEAKYESSLWTIKTILQRSESNDSRPILLKKDFGFKGYHVVLGGKIDNVYDAIEEISNW